MGQHHDYHHYGDVSREDDPVVDLSDVHPPTRPRQRHVLRNLGWHATVALAGGTLVLLGCVGFLSFLWFSDESNATWRAIIVNDWLTRSITITSLVLRWTVTVQAAAVTSMTAALLLQHSEAPLPHAAAISLAVFANSGPHEILPRLPRARCNRSSSIFWLIVVILVCTTMLLQFTSTVLLSNVGIGTIMLPKSMDILYGSRPNMSLRECFESDARGYLQTRPIVFSAFAEYSELATPQEGVSDTGLSMRAFLPIKPQSERERTVSYSGKATLLDARVVCVRPLFRGVTAYFSNFTEASGRLSISGRVWTNETVRRLRTSSPGDVGGMIPFNCTFYMQQLNKNRPDFIRDEWPVSLCNLHEGQDGGLRFLGVVSDMLPTDYRYPGTYYLIINMTDMTTDWDDINSPDRRMNLTQSSMGASEWSTLSNINGVAFTSTLCSVDPQYQNTNVTVSRPGRVPEPSATWVPILSSFDTGAVRRQLGATNDALSPSDRGIFSLNKKDSWLHPETFYNRDADTAGQEPPEVTNAGMIAGAAFAGLMKGITVVEHDISIPLCGFCGGTRAVLSPLHANMFQDTLKATGSAAPALQGLITSLFATSHHDHMYLFNVWAPAEVVEETDVTLPTDYGFFVAVMVLLGVHWAVSMTVTTWFWRQTGDGRGMLVGASWAAVARVSGPQVDRWLILAGWATDKEVIEAMKAGDTEDAVVGVAGDGERVGLRQRSNTAKA